MALFLGALVSLLLDRIRMVEIHNGNLVDSILILYFFNYSISSKNMLVIIGQVQHKNECFLIRTS